MGKAPAYVFVVRHGNRLDVADKRWLHTSAAPYDPPLTYGGWLQARSLGARIAEMLRQAESDEADEADDDDEPRPDTSRKTRTRFKVVLHSSPFLRCVQTSIAISAGICEPPGSPAAYPRPSRSNSFASGQVASPLRTGGTFGGFGLNCPDGHYFDKTVLRLDSFLGEWLSPEYFEAITPPPPSSTLVTIAKTDLLRREDYARYGDPSLQVKSVVGYRRARKRKRSGEEAKFAAAPEALEMSSMAQALAGTLHDAPSAATEATDTPTGYLAPSPHYAVSNNSKIPDGYVAHARDACVLVDLQWDSGNTPLNWGDGGSYGEEWTAMHKRFRNGLQRLVDWYSTTEHPADPVSRSAPENGHQNGHATAGGGTGSAAKRQGNVNYEDEDDDEEDDYVVILVSHGAGCNAMIGAITHQPALMDVGTASLTMAARKPAAALEAITPTADAASPHLEVASHHIHQLYDMKITANTDHLRTSVATTPATSRSPSGVNLGSRGRISSMGQGPSIGPFKYAEPHRSNSANASFSPLRIPSNSRGSLAGLATPGVSYSPFSATAHHRQSSLGLWSPIPAQEEEDEEDDYFPSFDRKHRGEDQTKASATEDAGSSFDFVSSPVASTPRSPALPIRGPSRQLSESSDDFMAAQLGFPPVASGGGLWASSREASSRPQKIDETKQG